MSSSAADGVVTLTSQTRPGSSVGASPGQGRLGARVLRSSGTWPCPPATATTITVRVEPVRGGKLRCRPRTDVGTHPSTAAPRSSTRSGDAGARGSAPADPRFDELLATCTDELAGLRITDPTYPDRVDPRRRSAVVHDDLRPRLPAHELDAAPARRPDRPRARCSVLADRQGTRVEPRTEEEPGRILHEIRSGLTRAGASGGDTVYYGTADATPLFVMLVGELRRWGVPLAELEPLLPHVDRALDWVDDLRRPGRRRLRRVRAGHRRGTGQPGLEGLLRRDHLPVRRAPPRTHRAGRGAGLRLRAPSAPAPRWPEAFGDDEPGAPSSPTAPRS